MSRPSPADVVELRCASAFSFLEGASNPEDLAERAAELGYGAVALADRGGLYGIPRFHQAAKAYQNDPIALQLRQMNILYEGLKQKGGMMVVPSSIVDSMGPAGTLSLAALAKGESARVDAQRSLPQPSPHEPEREE